MDKTIFQFSNVVVVDDDQIGVIVKTWHSSKRGYHYEVYVRNYNEIREYDQDQINHFEYNKDLSEEEKGFY